MKLRKINIAKMKNDHSRVRVYLIADNGKGKNFSLARLVLSIFKPPQDNRLYCTHIDRDKYNCKLSNLQWSETVPIKQIHTTTSVTLDHEIFGKQEFESIKVCIEYLNSLNIKINKSTITKLCQQKSKLHGFKFAYSDEKKYILHVDNLASEEWKMFHQSVHKNYYVSSCGRIKWIGNNGKERLLKQYLKDSYYIIGCKYGDESTYVHRIVAKHWVPNPFNYRFVDHKDLNTKNNHYSNLRWQENLKENYSNIISANRLS
eukprot:399501_1